MEPLVFFPSTIDLGIAPSGDRPISRCFVIENRSNSLLLCHFGKISNSSVWFTNVDDNMKNQRKSGFEIFFVYRKLDELILYPHTSTEISLVFIPSKSLYQFPQVISLSASAYEYEGNELKTLKELSNETVLYESSVPLTIQATLSDAIFKIDPPIIFMKDCLKNDLQMCDFTLRNLCDAPLPIMIHSIPSIKILTPSIPNFIELPPKGIVPLQIQYQPMESGHFENKVQFNCLITNDRASFLRVISSVSPSDIPQDFPIINQGNGELHLGNVFAGVPIETMFTVQNSGQKSYKVRMIGIFDVSPSSDVLLSQSQTLSSSSQFEQLNHSSSQIRFRTPLSTHLEPSLFCTLDKDTTTTYIVNYVPNFNLVADPHSFDQRSFMISFEFTPFGSSNTYYRLLNCRVSVCHSQIIVSPKSVDFGDTVIGSPAKHSTIQITNISPLPTDIVVSTSARSISFSSLPLAIQAHSSISFPFTFYPRKVNPDYSSAIKFTNIKNIDNTEVLSVSAVVISGQQETIHTLSYSVSSNSKPLNSLDFGYIVSSFPAIRHIVIKNKLSDTLFLTISSSEKEELRVFFEENTNLPLQSPLTGSNSSFGSLNDGPLIRPQMSQMSLSHLEKINRENPSFYHDMFPLYNKHQPEHIVDHFDAQREQFEHILDSGTVKDLTFKTIEILPSAKIDLYIVITPHDDADNPGKWVHRKHQLSISLNNFPDSEPLTIPVNLNVATSVSFLSSHSLNFGDVQCNSKAQYNIDLVNESAVPLLFRIETKPPVFIDKFPVGIVFPLTNFQIPLTLSPRIQGKIDSYIKVMNTFNPIEEQRIRIKANVYRRSNFYVNPADIDFGPISAGSSSNPVSVFVTNTSNEEVTFTFSHINKDRGFCKPLMMYQIQNLSERRLNEAIKLQIDKLQCKLKIYERKKKVDKISSLQKLIDDLSNTQVKESETNLKQLGAKYMDRLTIRAEPLQVFGIEFQLIPSIKDNKKISFPIKFDGNVIIYEKGRNESQKIVKYQAEIIPDLNYVDLPFLPDFIVVEPNNLDFGSLNVQSSSQRVLTIYNKYNSPQSFWFSSNSTNNAIISSSISQGTIKTGDSIEIPIDLFCLKPGKISKEISIITPNTTIKIPVVAQGLYRQVITFQGLSESLCIDFGVIPLVSLRLIEERQSFSITNISDDNLFIYIKNSNSHDMVVYENDPKVPTIKAFMLPAQGSVNVNVLFKPELDIEHYRSYTSTIIEDNLTLYAFSTEEEAISYSSSGDDSKSCIFSERVSIKATIGRIGFSVSESTIDLGVVTKVNQTIESHIVLKNRSSHIPITVFASCSQGLTVTPSTFTLPGKKLTKESQEISISYQPNSWGMNEGIIRFSTLQNIVYSKSISVSAFADQSIIMTDLMKNSKGYSELNIGPVYIDSGVPIKKSFSFKLINKSFSIYFIEILDYKIRLSLRPMESATARLTFPLHDSIYHPDDTSFTQRIVCIDSSTRSIVQVVMLQGEFIVSNSTIQPDTLTFPRFGRINQWKYEDLFCTIINQSNVDLKMRTEYDSQYLVMPNDIPIIPSYEKHQIRIIPNIHVLKDQEGLVTTNMRFINVNNQSNVLTLQVSFDISSTFLQLHNVIDNRFDTPRIDIAKFKEITDSTLTSLSGTNWFAVTNRTNDEINVAIGLEQYFAESISLELFFRNSEQKLSYIILQPNEKCEIRIRATIKEKGKGFLNNKEEKIAIVSFSIPNEDPIYLDVFSLSD